MLSGFQVTLCQKSTHREQGKSNLTRQRGIEAGGFRLTIIPLRARNEPVYAGGTTSTQTPTEWRTVGGEGRKATGPAVQETDEPAQDFHSVDLWGDPPASSATLPTGTPDSQNDNRGSGVSSSLETTGNNPATGLFPTNHAIALTIAQKLKEAGLEEYAQKLEACHSKWTALRCKHCGKRYLFPKRCDLRFCPNCQHRLSIRRQRELEWWITLLNKPKHVVLTVRNAKELTADYIRWVKACFAKLRRRKFARSWKSGIYSVEVTNEGRGWHVHIHALVQAPWIDAKELARQWASLVGQDFAIVWVKQAADKGVAKEILKYAVKGNQIATWTPEEVRQYVLATEGVRLFGRFGELAGEAEKWKRELEELVDHGFRCECGSEEFEILRDLDYLTAIRIVRGPPGFWDQYLEERQIQDVIELASTF